MKLYGFPFSPNTWKVRAVLNHLRMPIEFVMVDLTKPRSAEYLALNANGRTPTLVDGDFTLWESNAIMQYLAAKTPNALWPDDARKRADIARWQCWQLAHWGGEACGPLTFQRVVKRISNLGPPDERVVAAATAAFNRYATVLDQKLARNDYLVGDALTLADLSVAASMVYCKEAEMPVAPYSHVRAWFERVTALPSWREAAPQLPAAA